MTPPKHNKKPAAPTAAAPLPRKLRTSAPAALARLNKPSAAAPDKKKKGAASLTRKLKIKPPLKQKKALEKEEERCLICLEALPPLEKRGLRSAGVVGIGAGCEHEFCQPCLSQVCTCVWATVVMIESIAHRPTDPLTDPNEFNPTTCQSTGSTARRRSRRTRGWRRAARCPALCHAASRPAGGRWAPGM